MDEPHWVKRFTDHGAPGAYLRVVAEGTVGAGDEIEVVHRPDHGVTIGEVFVIRRADADRLRRALDDPEVDGEMADDHPARPRGPRTQRERALIQRPSLAA